jgi:hypothetical protein
VLPTVVDIPQPPRVAQFRILISLDRQLVALTGSDANVGNRGVVNLLHGVIRQGYRW